jgi:hypothetical protein
VTADLHPESAKISASIVKVARVFFVSRSLFERAEAMSDGFGAGSMTQAVQYNWDDLRMFSRASHDNSRLHMSEEYARETVYGEPPVFGILGAFAALSALKDRPGQELAKVSLDYRAPFFMNVNYFLESSESSSGRSKVRLRDAESVLMAASFTFRELGEPATVDDEFQIKGIAPSHEQADWKADELKPGVKVSGRYAPSPDALAMILLKWKLTDKGVTLPQIGTMLWSSYLTGMQLPGLPGTSAHLRLSFGDDHSRPESPFDYETTVADFDKRFPHLHLLTSHSVLRGQHGTFAEAEIVSHVRGETSGC